MATAQTRGRSGKNAAANDDTNDDWGDPVEQPPAAALREKGDGVIGVYLGCRIIRTKFGMRRLHRFRKKDATLIEYWGASSMDRNLAQCELGRVTRVLRTGDFIMNSKGEPTRAVKYMVNQKGDVWPHAGLIGRDDAGVLSEGNGASEVPAEDDIPF